MYYRIPVLIVAVIFTVLAAGCGGQQQQNDQQKQNARTEQAKQETTQQPAGETTMMQNGSKKSQGKAAGTKGKKNEGAQKAGAKGKGKAGKGKAGKGKAGKGKAGKARTVKGVLGTVKLKESKIYFKPQSGKARGGKTITLAYHPKQLRITLGGKKAQVRDLERGQHARATYTSRKVEKKGVRLNQRYVVHSIKAFAKVGKKPAGKQKNKANG